MANLQRVRCNWSGSGVVGPGVTTFYVQEAYSGWLPDLNTFWSYWTNRIPAGITVSTPSTGDLIDVATGEISGSWTESGASNVAMVAAGAYAKGVGCRIAWQTDGVRAGRRVRGSTFIVPLQAGNYSVDGTLEDAAYTAFTATANALVAALEGNLVIYSRPGTAGAGQASPVIAGQVKDTVSWLRSRRT